MEKIGKNIKILNNYQSLRFKSNRVLIKFLNNLKAMLTQSTPEFKNQ
jgi:hypothetical protein